VNRRRLSAVARVCFRGNRHMGRWIWAVVLAALFPASAWAELHAMPYADVSYQYNSNIFALPFDEVSDRILEERAGAEALYGWSRQEFYANGEWRHYGYDQLSDLSHDEYLVHGGMKWKLASVFDGVLDYRRERSEVNFLEFAVIPTEKISTLLYLQDQSVSTASFNIQFAPDWRLQSLGTINNLDSPRPGLPDLSLTEDSIDEGIRYVGVAKLSAGIDAIYLKGHFNNGDFVLTPRYDQTTLQAAAKYVATGLSSFDGAIGYTRRDQGVAGTVGGTTGLLAYTRNLTGKTSINIKLLRAVNSYVTYGGTEVDTGVNLGAIWNAAEKIAVTPGYQWTQSTFPGADQAVNGRERLDHYQLATLQVKYQIQDWVSLRPFGQYETRHSNVEGFSFNRTIYGIEFEVRLPTQADEAYELYLPD
jgi:hypothetical protein